MLFAFSVAYSRTKLDMITVYTIKTDKKSVLTIHHLHCHGRSTKIKKKGIFLRMKNKRIKHTETTLYHIKQSKEQNYHSETPSFKPQIMVINVLLLAYWSNRFGKWHVAVLWIIRCKSVIKLCQSFFRGNSSYYRQFMPKVFSGVKVRAFCRTSFQSYHHHSILIMAGFQDLQGLL